MVVQGAPPQHKFHMRPERCQPKGICCGPVALLMALANTHRWAVSKRCEGLQWLIFTRESGRPREIALHTTPLKGGISVAAVYSCCLSCKAS